MMPLIERMACAKAKMVEERKRTPRVFFLSGADYAEFCLTGPDYRWVPFHQGGKPTQLFCALFDGVAVRGSTSDDPKYRSRLFCCAGTTVQVSGK